ncbi:MAG: TIGR04283 family arsenosugar biosynthesis glycosyltransferase [Oscillospiraceae bacterium]|nr:TIGR04283 family arsenosugar biosynthesis glycosyltransferase [Oscillospiraceae bacterium]
MKISVIIPIYNESKTIDNMLNQLDGIPGDWEIIFADGGSHDDTLEQIGNRYRVLSCPKGRANQMNFAAEKAIADVLWFVHCDSLLPRDAHGQIENAVQGGARWGCFHIGFDYDGPFMGCNTYFSNRRAKKGIAFGDQGIWVRKDHFIQMGGFPDLPIMEDYEFSRRMKAAKVPITQLPGRIVTSGRRYRGSFPLLTMWKMFYLRCLYRSGVDIQEIARRYRDIR